MKTVTITEARKHWFKLFAEVSQSHTPLMVKGKHTNNVVIGEDDWRAIEETLYLLSIPGMRASLIKGHETPVEKCSTRDKLPW